MNDKIEALNYLFSNKKQYQISVDLGNDRVLNILRDNYISPYKNLLYTSVQKELFKTETFMQWVF